MHNIHYIIIEATSHEEAQSYADDIVNNWATENNWYSVISSLSFKDKSIKGETSRKFNLNCLNEKVIRKNIEPKFKYEKPTKEKILEAFEDEKDSDYINRFMVKYYLEFLNSKKYSKTDDIWNANYYQCEFDEVGITNITTNDTLEDEKYIVAMDIHS